MSKSKVFKLTVPLDLDRQRLDKVLVTLLAAEAPGAYSRVRLQDLIEKGHVTHSKKAVLNSSRKVKTDEVYEVRIPPAVSSVIKAQKIALNVIYEDKDVLVIDKPVGMVVHPAPGNRDKTLVNALLAHCGKSLSGIGGVARPGIVHRLDKDTSGLMVIAKNDMAHQALTAQFSDRSLSRIYCALVWGHPIPTQGKIEGSIGRHPKDRKKMTVTAKGREALTYYKVLKSYEVASLVECKLATGRTHQIRVHMAYKKHPVVGDAVYGGRNRQAAGALGKILQDFPRQALHAMELQFQHPRTGKPVRFKSDIPKDIKALIRALK